jgi:hypothetical protein
MDRYLIILPHTDEECVRALKQVEAIGMITHFDWGCKDNDHTGYVCLEAESRNEALLSVPSADRPRARVIKMNKFSPEDVRAMHESGH